MNLNINDINVKILKYEVGLLLKLNTDDDTLYS